jgi:hypothetical protein
MIDTQLISLLESAIKKIGSQAEWADMHGISRSYVNDVVHGRRTGGKKILDALGVNKVTVLRRVK